MRRALTAALLALALEIGACAPASSAGAAERAARFLLAQQSEDGGWHSRAYGLLASGQSLTPFVIGALLDAPGGAPREAVDRALVFLARHVDADGALGRVDPDVEDYPNYATALAVRALVRAGVRAGADAMVACLLRQQYAEDRGWTETEPAHGAWGIGGPLRSFPFAGHVDLSMTRHVLAGLAAAGVGADDPAMRRAARFLARVQQPDGGFVFSTVVVDANKAGADGAGFRSYGTATADGILALLATGARRDDPRVVAAARWLVAHHRTDAVPGFPDGEPAKWRDGMRFYYLAASAEALAALGVDEAPMGRDWRAEMGAVLRRAQRADGSFANPSFLMKEDDPLIATTLALKALLATRPRA